MQGYVRLRYRDYKQHNIVIISQLVEAFVNNREFELARHVFETTDKNLLIIGRAGTGKTTFLNNIVKDKTDCIVLAPSGIAALEAGGRTIHSFFRFDTLPYVPETDDGIKTMPKSSYEVIRHLKTLVIDEVSMVRCDLLDRVDHRLRTVMGNSKPFGGKQVILIGDPKQLPPVVEDGEDKKLIDDKYAGNPFFFNSKVFPRAEFLFLEFKTIYRQDSSSFKDLLNRVRDNTVTPSDVREINRCFTRDSCISAYTERIAIVTHKYKARIINRDCLNQLGGETFKSVAEFSNWYDDDPAPRNLQIKVGAHVMFLKNSEVYKNGTLGIVTYCDEWDDKVRVKINATGKEITVEPATWISYDFRYDEEKGEIIPTERGYYRQYPLQLAWAITVHKSQGQTFDKVLLDIKDCFAEGQAYVALSRCRDISAIKLKSKFSECVVKVGSVVDEFIMRMELEQPFGKVAEAVGFTALEECTCYRKVMDSSSDTTYNIREKLKIWRSQVATREGLSAEDVISKYEYRGIARENPQDIRELEHSKFLSPDTFAKYGKEIMKVIKS